VERIFKDQVLNIPNLLTVVRIALLPAIVWRFRLDDRMGALLIYLAAMVTDIADGFIARRTHQITALGKLLDPIADKLCLLTLLFLFSSEGQISVWMLNIIAAKELVLILGSAAALHSGVIVSALPIGKLTTLMFVFSMIAHFLRKRILADHLFMISVLLSCASLLWYSVVFIRTLQSDHAIE